MSDRILITGGAGFIGLHLARNLAEVGYNIVLVDNYSRGIRDREFEELISLPNISFREVDLIQADIVRNLGTDYAGIFHLAAIVGVKHVLEHPYKVLVQNTQMLDNIIELALKQTLLSGLLFSSTSEVYAGASQHIEMTIPTPETSPLILTNIEQPRTTYMLSKIMGEAMCKQSGLPVTIFRPHNIYGPRMGMSHVIPEQLGKAWKANDGDSVPVDSVNHRRAFCYIDDAVEMLKRMLETKACRGSILNLGTSSPEVSMRSVAEVCYSVVGKNLKVSPLPPTTGSPERRAPDMSKTSALVNYKSKVGLEDGIKKTWTWYKEIIFEGGNRTAI